jgi:hypothetical protein
LVYIFEESEEMKSKVKNEKIIVEPVGALLTTPEKVALTTFIATPVGKELANNKKPSIWKILKNLPEEFSYEDRFEINLFILEDEYKGLRKIQEIAEAKLTKRSSWLQAISVIVEIRYVINPLANIALVLAHALLENKELQGASVEIKKHLELNANEDPVLESNSNNEIFDPNGNNNNQPMFGSSTKTESVFTVFEEQSEPDIILDEVKIHFNTSHNLPEEVEDTEPVKNQPKIPLWQNLAQSIPNASMAKKVLLFFGVSFFWLGAHLVSFLVWIIRGFLSKNPKYRWTHLGQAFALVVVVFNILMIWWWFSVGPLDVSVKNFPVGIVVPNRKPVESRLIPADLKISDIKAGVRRGEMNASQLKIREILMDDTQTFYALRFTGQAQGLLNVLKLDSAVTKAVAKFIEDNPDMATSFEQQLGLSRENLADLILAIIWKESGGNWNAKSDTGPVGPGQFAKAAAVEVGLCTPVYKTNNDNTIALDSKGNKIIASCSVDLRNDPDKVIPAMLQRLKNSYYKLYQRWDLAIFAYHSGDGDVKSLLAAAQEDKLQWTYYSDLFFADPKKYPKTDQKIQELSTADQNFGATYFFGVRRNMELIWEYYKNPVEFQKIVDKQRSIETRGSKNDPVCGADQKCAPYLAYSWYSQADMKYKIAEDLYNALKSGELVHLEDGRPGLYYAAKGDDGIGEKARTPEEAAALRSLRPCAAQILYSVGWHYSQFYPVPLKVTSAVRSHEYQLLVGKEELSLAAHETGFTFDISQKGMSKDQQARLGSIFNDLQYAGLLSWKEEESKYYNAFHVVVSPLAQRLLGCN